MLIGRQPPPVHTCKAEVDRIVREWREYELSLNSYMEKMNAWAGRVAKREKRAAQKLLEMEGEGSEPAQHALPLDPKSRKAALRQALREGRRLPPLHRKAEGES